MLFSALRSLFSGGSVDLSMIVAQILSVLFIIIFVLPLHEFAHGLLAVKMGDPTPKYDKRLTLNPLASIDPIGSLALLLFGYGWAKPVQVNPRNFKNPKRDMAIVALAGPISNFIAALVGAFIYVAIMLFAPVNIVTSFLGTFLSSYIIINVALGVFNLLPIPPLDGSRIVSAFLSDKAMYTYYRYQNMFMLFFFLAIFSGVLSGPLQAVENVILKGILGIAQFPFSLFMGG